MEDHAKKCVERYCELANKTTQQLYKVTTPFLDEHEFKEEELGSVGEVSKVCSQIVLKCLYLARIGRPDILWSVNKLARAATKWIRAFDKRWARLISYIHRWIWAIWSCGKHCATMQTGTGSGLWFWRRTWRLKIDLRRILCIFGSHTFVPMSWMCKKQTSVSHSSTESEIVSLDAGLRMDGIPALDLWDLFSDVLHSSSNQPEKPIEKVQGNLLHDTPWRKHTNSQTMTQFQYNDLEWCNVDDVSSNVKIMKLW